VPWQESPRMSESLVFVQACLDRKKRIVEICSEFGISEKVVFDHKDFYRARHFFGFENKKRKCVFRISA
jgi:hypothetical protein